MLRILAVSDIHGSGAGALAVKRMAAEHTPDLVVVCGDITNFGRKEWEGGLLDFTGAPVLAVDGNCDAQHVTEALLSDRERGLVNRTRQFRGLAIAGLGYPPDIDCLPEHYDILVSHVPPRGCNDSVRAGHIGNDGIRQLVLERKPLLVLSGHVHEARGTCKLGGALCVNPGPAMEGFGAVVEIEETVEARLVRI